MNLHVTASRIFTESSTVCLYLILSLQVLTYCVEKQTVEFNIKARVNFKTKTRARMSVWEAMEMLNTLIDESDPDVRFHPIRSSLSPDFRLFRQVSPR